MAPLAGFSSTSWWVTSQLGENQLDGVLDGRVHGDGYAEAADHGQYGFHHRIFPKKIK